MKLYPDTYLTTDGVYDRSHRIWEELILIVIAYPFGFVLALIIA